MAACAAGDDTAPNTVPRLTLRRFVEQFADVDVRAQFAAECAAAGVAPDDPAAGQTVYRMIAKGSQHAASRAKAKKIFLDAVAAAADAEPAPVAAAPADEPAPVAAAVALDHDQMQVRDQTSAMLNEPRPGQRLLVMAGPGAGKTTTLIETIVALLQEDPARRILVLAFNVAAEETVADRLKAARVRRIYKSHAFTATGGGCAAMTFDKAASQLVVSQGTYNQRKELAGESLERSPELAGQWNLVVVDEAQDVTPLEARIVEGLLAGSGAALLAAGDPRQEVRAGAAWFSREWARNAGRRTVLTRNYRSGAHIVAALNDFSRAAFPRLHHDQVPVHERPGVVQVLLVPGEAGGAPNNTQIGRVVGETMAAAPPGSAYGIVPCSLMQWKLCHATLSACQQINGARPADAIVALTQDTPIPKEPAYLFATAARLKGTERELVVVYGADREYVHRVSDEQLAKAVFVALSRACSRLVVVTTRLNRQRIKHLMAPLFSSPAVLGGGGVVTAAEPQVLSLPALQPIPVTGENLAGSNVGVSTVPYQSTPWCEVSDRAAPALTGLEGGAVAAFAGFMAEGHIAAALAAECGVVCPLLSAAAEVVPFARDEYRGCQFYYFDGVQQVYVEPRHRDAMEAYLRDLRACSELAAPYVHSAIKMTATAGREWTLHSPLADADANAALAAEARAGVAALCGLAEELVPGATDAAPQFWSAFMQPLCVCRRGRDDPPRATNPPAVCLRGEIDIVWGGVVIELKHCAVDDPAHERQLITYMLSLGLNCGILYNTRRGEMRAIRITDPDAAWAELNARARALQALGFVQSCGHLVPHAVPLPAPLQTATTVIFVDTETDSGLVIEVGAVAVHLANWSVIGTFEGRSAVELLRGKPPNKCAAVHRLQWTIADPAARKQASDQLRADFAAWVAAITPAVPLYVHWAGTERGLVGDAPTLDARTVFRDWLRAKSGPGAAANSTGLDAAMQRLFTGVIPFTPHIALEDAIATAAVLMAVVQRGGVM
jgi:hypothetical protein